MLGNIIVILVLAVIVFFAGSSTVRHMRGEGDCCGGGDVGRKPKRVKKQRLTQVVAVKKVTIAGMTCAHCQAKVENALNSLEQVNAVVDLLREEAIVKLGTDVADEILRNAVEEAGYKVVAIEKQKE